MAENAEPRHSLANGAWATCATAWSRADLAALAVLWLTATVVAAPILFGGWNTYLDNPVHVAELYEMGRLDFRGWSDIGLCGLPLGALHSPLWFGLLAMLHRWGLPLGLLYSLSLLISFAAPSTVVYSLARRRLTAAPSCAIAYLLLIQYPASIGIASALGGMWTFYLASAFLLLLLDALARPTRSLTQAIRIAALTGLVGLSHSFFFAVLGLTAALHGVLALIRRKPWLVLRWDAPAMAIGLLAASAYWLPLLLTRQWLWATSTNLPAAQLVQHLLLPLDVLQIRQGTTLGWSAWVYGWPMVLLVLLGLVGTVLCLFHHEERKGAVLPGLLLGWLIFLLLVFVLSNSNIAWLGPISWRLLYLTRLGFALAAIAVMGRFGGRWRTYARAPLLLAGVLAIALGAVWGQPLARTVPLPADREVLETRQLWQWLGQNRAPGWGRVLLQDTFFSTEASSVLSWSHLLARTAMETGVEQVGPYYSTLPFPTDMWTLTEFSRLLGVVPAAPASMQLLKMRMTAANATHAVLLLPWAKAWVEEDPDFKLLRHIGDFTVYQFRGGLSKPAFSASPVVAHVDRLAPGQILVQAENAQEADLLLAEAYHPFWTVDARTAVTLAQAEIGLMKLHLPAGHHEIRLEYHPPKFPGFISSVTWALLGMLWLALQIHYKRRHAPTP